MSGSGWRDQVVEDWGRLRDLGNCDQGCKWIVFLHYTHPQLFLKSCASRYSAESPQAGFFIAVIILLNELD
jgi:hypothetical protein